MKEQQSLTDSIDQPWKGIYLLGAVATILVLLGTVIDIIIGTITGGNLTALPQTAAERFLQLQSNPLLGLYNLDLLNVVNQIIMIATYFALYAAHRKAQNGFSLLALIVFLVGTCIFIVSNVALPMYELSLKYAACTTDAQRKLFVAAGEGMMARGTHGSLGVFIGFILPNIAGMIISCVMIKGAVFSKVTGYLGLIGSILISVYIILVTFVHSVQSMATMFAAPAGLLLMAWMVLFTIRLIKLGRA